jgi:tRNA A37 threonylcarbamoyladenosine dehydratase
VAINDKLKPLRIGIVGLGGTGSYVLDFVAKTPVKESLPIWPLITLEVTPLATHLLFADQSTFGPGSHQTQRSPPA